MKIKHYILEPDFIEKSKKFPLQGKVTYYGLKISIENKAGSLRKGIDPDGKHWKTIMKNDYGYIKGTIAGDKDHLDVFLGSDLKSEIIFVVKQVKPWLKDKPFDEYKVMIGFTNVDDAKKAYLSNYDTEKYFGDIYSYTLQQFKKLIGYNKKGVANITEKTFEKANESFFGFYILN